MSRGLGWVQRACLLVLEERGSEDEWSTTYNIAADVYHVAPDADGNRYITDAQHVAVKRALESLQRKGVVIGFRSWRARDPGFDGRTVAGHVHWLFVLPHKFAPHIKNLFDQFIDFRGIQG